MTDITFAPAHTVSALISASIEFATEDFRLWNNAHYIFDSASILFQTAYMNSI